MTDQNNNNHDEWSNRNWQDAKNFGSSRPNGYGNGFFSRNQQTNNNDSNNMRGMFGGIGNNSKLGGNWLQGRNSMLVVVVVLIIVIIYTFYSQSAMNAEITKSTIDRTKIESEFNYKTDECYTDLGDTVEDDAPLRNSFKTFHNKTGIIPYVYVLQRDGNLTSQSEMDKLAGDFYKDNIKDEDHFLAVIDPEDPELAFSYKSGTNAEKVMDSEAIQIFKDYLAKFYKDRQTNNQTYLVNTFGYTADRIMSTKNYSSKSYIFGGVIIVILVIVIIGWMRKRKNDGNNAGGNNPAEGSGRNYYDENGNFR